MTADTLKTTRVLELYQDFLSGKLINKQKAAEQYHVNVRSIQRDIDSIRDFLSEQCAKEGIVRKIEYDKKENGWNTELHALRTALLIQIRQFLKLRTSMKRPKRFWMISTERKGDFYDKGTMQLTTELLRQFL